MYVQRPNLSGMQITTGFFVLSPFTYFENLAPDDREGREKESAMHWGLPEESTEGLMDLLASLLEVSVAGPGGLPIGPDQHVRGSKADFRKQKGFTLLGFASHHL